MGYFLHKHRVANGAIGLGGATQRNGDVEKTQAPVELHQVQEPHQQQMYQQQPAAYPAT